MLVTVADAGLDRGDGLIDLGDGMQPPSALVGGGDLQLLARGHQRMQGITHMRLRRGAGQRQSGDERAAQNEGGDDFVHAMTP